MRFELTAVDRAGIPVRYVLDAENAESARALAGAGGHAVIDLRALGSGSSGGIRRRQALLSFCEALEQVLSGGLTLGDALHALGADAGSDAAAIAASLSRQLQLGLSPSQAFTASGEPWPPLLVALLRSGERSGRLDAAVASFIAAERRWFEVRAKVVSASVYPLVLLAISMLVLMFLLGFVVPKFAAALDDLRTELPGASRWLIDLGRWVGAHVAEVAGGLALAVAAAALLARAPGVRARLSAATARLPWIARVLHLRDRAQALRIIAALLSGGSTLPAALAAARGSVGAHTGALLERARLAVASGQRPSQALGPAPAAGGPSAVAAAGAPGAAAAPAAGAARAGLLDPVAAQLVSAAERRGGLAGCFERLAERDEQALVRLLDRAASVYGPVLLLGIAMIVGAVVVALYWPMLQMFDRVG